LLQEFGHERKSDFYPFLVRKKPGMGVLASSPREGVTRRPERRPEKRRFS
jgi:hypothetical protein